MAAGTHWIGGWVGPRPKLDLVEKIPAIQPTGGSNKVYPKGGQKLN
jgi:hypothetical protein